MVSIGTLTPEERIAKIAYIREMALKYFNNPRLLYCELFIEGPCKYKKKPRSLWCARHNTPVVWNMYVIGGLTELIGIHRKTRVEIAKIDPNDEDLSEIDKMILDTKQLIEKIKRSAPHGKN
jgi:hypothetical protein